jgi:hypothetical protein
MTQRREERIYVPASRAPELAFIGGVGLAKMLSMMAGDDEEDEVSRQSSMMRLAAPYVEGSGLAAKCYAVALCGQKSTPSKGADNFSFDNRHVHIALEYVVIRPREIELSVRNSRREVLRLAQIINSRPADPGAVVKILTPEGKRLRYDLLNYRPGAWEKRVGVYYAALYGRKDV